MKISVLKIEDMGTGNLRAYATVQIGPLIIHRIRLVKMPIQKAYVAPPQFEYFANGRVNYTPVVTWPEEWKTPIFEAVWAAYDAQRQQKSEEIVTAFKID